MPTYSADGGPWTANGSARKTLSVVPVTAGDLLVLSFQADTITAFSSGAPGAAAAFTPMPEQLPPICQQRGR